MTDLSEVCFSFDCDFSDGSSTCTTTTPEKPTTKLPPTTPQPVVTTPVTKPPSTVKPTQQPITSLKPPHTSLPPTSPVTPSTSLPYTGRTSSITTHNHLTSSQTPTSTDWYHNNTTSLPPMRHHVTSNHGNGLRIYVPCSVVGAVVVIFIVVVTVFVRRTKTCKSRREETRLLCPEENLVGGVDNPQYITQRLFVQPGADDEFLDSPSPPPSPSPPRPRHSDPLFLDVNLDDDESADTDESEVERIDISTYQIDDPDDLETAPIVEIDVDIIFDRSIDCKKHKNKYQTVPKDGKVV